jgi:hypothetical protein
MVFPKYKLPVLIFSVTLLVAIIILAGFYRNSYKTTMSSAVEPYEEEPMATAVSGPIGTSGLVGPRGLLPEPEYEDKISASKGVEIMGGTKFGEDGKNKIVGDTKIDGEARVGGDVEITGTVEGKEAEFEDMSLGKLCVGETCIDEDVLKKMMGGNLSRTPLSVIAERLKPHLNSLKNPNFYQYRLDGNATYISDGGRDMYDGGNRTRIYLDGSVSGHLSYSQTTESTYNASNKTASYISLGYTPPLVMLTKTSARANIGFRKEGNLGADGRGSQTQDAVYNGQSIQGKTVYAWRRHVYNAWDPSVCDLYFFIGDASSTFYSRNIQTGYSNSTDNGYSQAYMDVSNVLAGTILLSKPSGQNISVQECQSVINNIVARLPSASMNQQINSLILQQSHIEQLQRWGVTPRTLLYRASRDGWSNTTFHRLADNQGATITVLKLANGYIAGGYTQMPWRSNGGYTRASNNNQAWLFNLSGNVNKYNIGRYPQYAIYNHSAYGPTFGGGHDLYLHLNNRYGHSYIHSYNGGWGYNRMLTGYTRFNRNELLDVEVWSV